MKKTKNMIYYDDCDDSLLFLSENSDNARHTIDTGLILLNLNARDNIVSFELMGAHKNFHIPKNILENLSKADIEFKYHKRIKKLIINISLYYKDKRPLILINNLDIDNHIVNQRMNASICASCS